MMTLQNTFSIYTPNPISQLHQKGGRATSTGQLQAIQCRALLGLGLGLGLVDRVTEEVVLTAPLLAEEPEDTEERGLPRSRRAHDHHELAFADREVGVAEHRGVAGAGGVGRLKLIQLDHQG